MASKATPSRLSREALAEVWIASLSLAMTGAGKCLSRARRQGQARFAGRAAHEP
jgi:hypothetical protein